ncbi:MAG: hypothetical protein ACJA08_002035 [Cyclobacteriaceae bacterium]|jgi:hypothetical protein
MAQKNSQISFEELILVVTLLSSEEDFSNEPRLVSLYPKDGF